MSRDILQNCSGEKTLPLSASWHSLKTVSFLLHSNFQVVLHVSFFFFLFIYFRYL